MGLSGDLSIAAERDFYRRLLDLSAAQDIEPLLDEALALIVEITGAQVAYLELYDDESGPPRFWKAYEVAEAEVEVIRGAISRGIIGAVVAEARTIETPSAMEDERFQSRGSVRHNAIEAVLCVPVGAEPVTGALYLQKRTRAAPFNERDRERAELFARQLAPLADRLLVQRHGPGRVDHTRAVRARFRCDGLVGRSEALARALHQASLVAPLVQADVLITGPAGTGKTVLAKAIVENSPRARAPFVTLNCAAIPEALIESELFGAERGSHSTATQRREGKVAAAEGGTLFLDEVAELSLGAQAALLQLLQDRVYYPLGATTRVPADIRVISATNADLKERVAARAFREDLYYRLHVMPVAMPGLDERREDIPELAAHACAEACRRLHLPAMTLSRRALLLCRDTAWPGHVRELAHAIDAAVIRAHGDSVTVVEPHHVHPGISQPATGILPLRELEQECRRRHVLEALERTAWNIQETCRQLDIGRSHLYNLIKLYGLRSTE